MNSEYGEKFVEVAVNIFGIEDEAVGIMSVGFGKSRLTPEAPTKSVGLSGIQQLHRPIEDFNQRLPNLLAIHNSVIYLHSFQNGKIN